MLIVIAVVALALAITAGVFATKRRSKTARIRWLEQLIKQIEAEDIEAARKLPIFHGNHCTCSNCRLYRNMTQQPELHARYRKALNTAKMLIDYDRDISSLESAFGDWQAASNPMASLKAWAEFAMKFLAWGAINRQRASRQLEYDHEQNVADYESFVQDCCAKWLTAARENDGDAFRRTLKLIERTRKRSEYVRGDLNMAGMKPLPYPKDWNDLVARHIKNPGLLDFVKERLPDDTPSGQIRLRAAEALRSGSLTEAKIVLACCNASSSMREEVGDYLTGLVAQMVANLQTADS